MWLRDEYHSVDAPLGSIRLLLCASDAERGANPELRAVDDDVPAPTEDNVRAALGDWALECTANRGDVAILYVAGHGIQPSKEGSVVLLKTSTTLTTA